MANPIVQAIIVCDHLYQDRVTGKTILSGTFSRISATRFPAMHGALGIYVALTDVSENGNIQVVLRCRNDERIAIPLPPWRVESREAFDRTATIEAGSNCHGLIFPVEGIYELAVHWNDAYIGSKHIALTKIDTQKGA